jgi:lysophospholipase L1-like esterase
MGRRMLVLVGIPVLLLVLSGPASAADHGQPPLAHRPLYLALGNSVAVGVGASDPAVTGYVPVFHDLLRGELACRPSHRPGCRKLALDNLAVGGATSTTLVRDQLPEAIAELQARNHDRRPKNDVKVITIDIGGNDVFAVVPSCAAGPTPECLGLIDTTLRTFAANFTTTLAQLRAAAGPDTVIIAMTYYNPLPSCRLSALAPLADSVLEGAPGFDGRLNDLIRAISAANGVAVADTYGRLAAQDLVGGDDCLHPNDSGHQIIADLFDAALAGSEAQGA